MRDLLDQLDPTVKHMADGAAAATAVLGGFLASHVDTGVLIITAIWTLIRIWETDTVRKWTGRDNGKTTDPE